MELYDNKYEFIKLLGEGGFGKVFLAKERISSRLVAIKQLKNTDKKEQHDIVYEIEIVSKFDHPNIVTYYHHFWQDEQLFLVMEYCAGGSLRDKMEEESITANNIFSWVQTLAACLRIVHQKSIIHHDIKPDNILFTESGAIKISDFGIANTGGGTRAYMSPEALDWDIKAKSDPRVDIYALGVTLMELLSGKNPFFYQSKEQIIGLHKKAEFPIKELPNWQQEIILKAINAVPELRFQYMVEFEEAINARSVPVIFDKEVVKAAELADYAERALKTKKWRNAFKYLEFAMKTYPENVAVLQVFGKYFLHIQKIEKAKICFEKALKLNPRLNLQKDLGWINLECQKYPVAIALLSDYLHRHPADYEAYNLLLRCYYETNRYEPAMELAKMLMEANDKLLCFANNYYISCVMHNIGQVIFPNTVLKALDNPFVDYNYSVILENKPSHDYKKIPTLKSKLLFMDYHFNTLAKNTFTILDCTHNVPLDSYAKTIIKIGRETYDYNDIQVPDSSTISRRHCIIINCKNDVWLYDLASTTGTFLNEEKVKHKSPVIGMNKLKIGRVEFTITTDKTKLL